MGYIGLGAISAQSLNWSYENIINDIGQSGENPDMFTAPNGDLHVSFWNNVSNQLMYAKRTKNTGQWTIETVDSSPSGYKSALLLDNDGKVHIAYLTEENDLAYISYANNTTGSWITETVTYLGQSLPSTPDMGIYGRDIANYYLRQSAIDIALQPNSTRPFITCFDGTINGLLLNQTGSLCDEFGFSDYELKPFMAWKGQNGTWSYKVMDALSTNQTPYAACWISNGDRSGEFSKIISKPNNTGFYILTNAIANQGLVMYSNTNSSLLNWASRKVDSSARFQSPFNGTSFTTESNRYSTFEHIDYEWANDSILYMIYGYSDFYGQGSHPKRATAFLAKANMKKFGTPNFAVTYFDFNPGSGTLPSENRDGFYRSQWSVAVRQGNQFTQQDTIFVAYSDDVNIKVQYSYNNGGSGSWIEQTIAANIPTTSPLNVDIYNDSVFVTGFNSFTNQLFVAKRLLLAGPNTSWDFQYATTTEDRGSVFDSEVMATGANEKIYTVFDEKFSKKLYFGQKQNGVWTYNLISNPADGIKYAKLAVKPNGEPVVVYSEKTSTSSEVLKAAYRNGSTWTYDILDGNSYPREFSVAMNGNKLHTAYYDAKEGALKYAYADISAATPSWTVELLDSSSLAVGRYASIFVATDNTVHISYKDVLNNQLLYLRKGTSTNNLWVKDTISNSLLLESPTYSQVHYNELDHVVRIAYKDESSNKLKIYVLWNDGVHTTGEIITGTSSVIGNPFRMIVTNSPISNEPTVWVAYNDILPGGNSSEVRIIRTWGGMWTWQQLSINNNIGLVGGSFDFNERNGDFYIIGKKTKQDDMGLALLWAQDAVSVNLEEQTLNLATDLVLYPNPADNLVSFQLHLPNTQEVKFQLFDLNGKTTNIAFNETLNEGIHTKNFSVEHLPAGIYIAHWQVGNQVITRKLIIAK